jgi:hypothetical protein
VQAEQRERDDAFKQQGIMAKYDSNAAADFGDDTDDNVAGVLHPARDDLLWKAAQEGELVEPEGASR